MYCGIADRKPKYVPLVIFHISQNNFLSEMSGKNDRFQTPGTVTVSLIDNYCIFNKY